MRNTLLAAACVALCTAALANPFGEFKGKMKPGLYETKMQMQIPGMPAGMGNREMTFQNCVSQQDIDKGALGRKDDNMPGNCEVKNFKISGNTASYTMACAGEQAMTADNVVTFRDGGYTMDMKMSMKQGGQVMNMNQRMEGRYVGACK